MKDIINEFQSNLPPSARRCALRQFSLEVYPKFAIIERSSHSASKKFSLWLIRDRLYGDILRESHRRRRWRAWEIVKTIERRKRNWKGWNSQTRRPASNIVFPLRETHEWEETNRKRCENGKDKELTIFAVEWMLGSPRWFIVAGRKSCKRIYAM